MVSAGPIVSGTATVRREKDVFRVEEVLNLRVLDTVDHTRFKIDEACAGDVAFIVCLVKEDVFAIIAAGGGEILQDAIVVDAVFQAQFLPKLGSDLYCGIR